MTGDDDSAGTEDGLQRRPFKAGETIFRQGEAGDVAYLVESGRIGIYRRYADLSMKLGTIGPGEVFGEMALIDGMPRVASAVCDQPSVVARIPQGLMTEKVASLDPLMRGMVGLFLKYIRANHESYGQLMHATEMLRLLEASADLDEALRLLPGLLPRIFEAYGGRMSLRDLDGRKIETICWGASPPQDEAAAFSVVLKDGHDVLGLLQLDRRPPDDLSGEQFIVTVAEHIGLTLSNLRLRQRLSFLASRDGLTGLYNRGYAEEWMANEVRLCRRRGTGLAVILMDLDFFKTVNDSRGHQAGDDVLRAIGQLLSETQRAGDIASRFGGEEFLLGLVDCNLPNAIRKAERMRLQVATLSVESGGQLLSPVTASFGVAVFPNHGDTYVEVVQAADDALYRAKKHRNRVEMAVSREVPSV